MKEKIMLTFRSTIPVSRGDDNEIVVGVGRLTGVTIQPVVVVGATLFVDVSDVHAVPGAVVTDPVKASWWLSLIYGSAVGETVARVANTRDATVFRVIADGDAAGSDLAAPLLRLAIGLWLYRWWPLPDRTEVPALDEDEERELEIELGTLAWYVDELFGEDPSVAYGLLAPNVDHVETMARSAIDGGLPPARVLAILRATTETVPFDDTTLTRFENLLNALTTLAEPNKPELASSSAAHLTVEGMRQGLFRFTRPAGAGRRRSSVAGGWATMGHALSGTSTVAWGRVPPRTLSTFEGNVSWTCMSMHGSDLSEFSVSVPVHPDSRALELSFVAVVQVVDSLVPLEVLPLTADSQERPTVLSGRALLPTADVPEQAGAVSILVLAEEQMAVPLVEVAVADTPEKRQRVLKTLNDLLDTNGGAGSTLAAQAAVPAYRVEPSAPWFPLRPVRS